MGKIIGLKELRLNTEKYIAEVGKGKSFTVVRRSKPVFKITPIDPLEADELDSGPDWKTVVDFRKYRKGGMPIEEVMKLFERSLNKKK